MMRKFAFLVSNTNASFRRREVRPSMIKSILENVRDHSNVVDTMISASEYWSFFNYEILENFIDKLGDDADKQGLAEYKSDFYVYCERRLSEVPIDALKSDRKVMTSLYVETDKQFNVCLKEIKKLQIMISKLLSCHLLLVNVGGTNSIELTFDYLEGNLHLASDDYGKLSHMGITRIYTDAQIFHDKSSKSLK